MHERPPVVPWDSWREALDRYSAATGLTVSAYDATGARQVGPVGHSRLAAALATPAYQTGACERTAFERALVEATATGGVASRLFDEQLRVQALPLTFAGKYAGAVVFGWVFADYPTELGTHRLARALGLDGRKLWSVVQLESPVSDKRMATFEALFASMLGWGSRLHETLTELERVGRARDALIAHVSHDLRTPLSALSLRVDLLLSRVAHQPELAFVHDALERMRTNIHDEAHMIEDLLEAAVTRTGKLTLRSSEVDLGALTRAACDSLLPLAEAKGVRLAVDGAPERPIVVWGDASRLQQVLWNVISNAVKFTPAGGDVRVTSRATDGRSCAIEVADTGPGIAPDLLPIIFEPFVRSTTGNDRGHGLGLSIARQIVQSHGGAMSVSSSPSGTTFRIDLPVAS